MATQPAVPDIITLLDGHALLNVAIIDDAFNEGVPSFGDINDALAEELITAIKADDQTSLTLEEKGITLESSDDLTQDVWNALWDNIKKIPELKRHLDQLGTRRNQNLRTLRSLQLFLQETLRRSVVAVPANKDLQDASAQILFIDYYLEGDDPKASLLLAQSVGKRIATLYSEKDLPPIIVLMSNRQELSEKDKMIFRVAAEFVGGMFHYIPKADLENSDLLKIFLYLVVSTYPQGKIITEFVSRVEVAAQLAVSEVRQRLMGLTVDDFGYIHQLTLAKEGVALSDYVTSLLGSLFNQEFRSRVLTDKQEVDATAFNQLSFQESAPSAEFASLFIGVVSQKTGALRRHANASEEVYAVVDSFPTDLHCGDLLVKEDRVFMVATPECDLICRPPSKEWKFDPDQQVLLIPGILEDYTKPWQKAAASRTEFVSINDTPRGIRWEFKKARTQPLGPIAKWASEGGYSRERRLNPEFALDVQRMFFNDVGRIGLPIGPPIYRSLGAVLYLITPDGKPILLLEEADESHRLCVSFLTRSVEHFQLTGDFLLRLPEAIEKASRYLEGAREGKEGKEKGRFSTHLASLKVVTFEHQKLDLLRKPFSAVEPGFEAEFLPLKGTMRISHKPIGDKPLQANMPLLLALGAGNRFVDVPSPGLNAAADVRPEMALGEALPPVFLEEAPTA